MQTQPTQPQAFWPVCCALVFVLLSAWRGWAAAAARDFELADGYGGNMCGEREDDVDERRYAEQSKGRGPYCNTNQHFDYRDRHESYRLDGDPRDDEAHVGRHQCITLRIPRRMLVVCDALSLLSAAAAV